MPVLSFLYSSICSSTDFDFVQSLFSFETQLSGVSTSLIGFDGLIDYSEYGLLNRWKFEPLITLEIVSLWTFFSEVTWSNIRLSLWYFIILTGFIFKRSS